MSSGGALHEGIRYFYLAAFEAGLRRVLVREGTCVLRRCAPQRYLVLYFYLVALEAGLRRVLFLFL